MKKKYPDRFKKTEQSFVKTKEEDKSPQIKKTKAPVFLAEKQKKQELWFKGEKIDILFSSEGLGIKKLRLKGYFDRENNPIEFAPKDQSLFSTLFFKSKSSL